MIDYRQAMRSSRDWQDLRKWTGAQGRHSWQHRQARQTTKPRASFLTNKNWESGHGVSISDFSFLVRALPKKEHSYLMVAFIKHMIFHKNVWFVEAL